MNTADPYQASAGPGDPGSWNRYSYTGGDPVNRLDPSGLDWITDFLSYFGYIANTGSLDPPGPGDLVGAQISAMIQQTLAAVAAFQAAAAQNSGSDTDCFAKQEYRSVAASGPLSQVNHAYFFVQDRNGNAYVLEGLPQFNPPHPPGDNGLWGHLQAHQFAVSANGSVAGDSRDHPVSDASTGSVTGTQTVICDTVDKLIHATNYFNAGPYDPTAIYGQNSNVFASYLAGLTGQNLGTPPSAPGYR